MLLHGLNSLLSIVFPFYYYYRQHGFLCLFSLTCSILALSHPAQQGEQLAAITHTQTQCVVPAPVAIKLSLGLGVICNSSSPTYYEGYMVLHKNNLYIKAAYACVFICL